MFYVKILVHIVLFLPIICCLSNKFKDEAIFNKKRILGGRSCQNETHSFIVSLQDRSGKHFCGGTLLNKWWVLTAAHCCVKKLVVIIAGRNTPEPKVRWVRKAYPHPSFDRTGLTDDIGLLKLTKPLDETKYISYINIPNEIIPIEIKDFCPTVLVMGWGKLTAMSKKNSRSLQCVDLPVLKEEDCKMYYRPYERVFLTAMCTLSEEIKDACQGDSGGPLLCKEKGVQLGIVSFGRECGDPSSPGVYTRVDEYVSFISKTMDNSKENYYTQLNSCYSSKLILCIYVLNILK